MTESQKAFEAAYPHYDQRLGADGKYHSRVSQGAYTYFTKGVAYGRKQALEDLKAAFLKFENNNVAQLAIVKELIK